MVHSGLPLAKSIRKPVARRELTTQGGGMKDEQVRELLYQALETEIGGVQIYTTALRCVQNEDLKEEWEEYLEQTKNHVQVMQNVFTELGLDPEMETPGRQVVRHHGESLVAAMEMALENDKP